MIRKRISYIFHPLVIGFLLSLSVIFVFARYLPRYNYYLIEEAQLNNKGEVYYFDLNNDGNSEKLHYYHYDRIFQPTLYLYDANDNFKSLWNFFESPVENSKIFVGDYNNDSIKEIYIFTKQADSLFLYVLDPENDRKPILNRKFISNISSPDIDIRINLIGLYDLNHKENKEFLFTVDVGYPIESRKIFSLDISNEDLISSQELHADIIFPIIVEDINSNGNLEIVMSNKSIKVIGNGSESHFMVLNNNLEYLVKPIAFIGGASQITAKTIISDEEKLIAVLHSGTDSDNVFNNLMLYNLKGEIVKELNIENKYNLSIVNINDSHNTLYLFSGKKIYKYSAGLKKLKTTVVSRKEKVEFVKYLDLSGDIGNELIFKDSSQLIIYNSTLKHKSILNIANVGKLILSIEKNIFKSNNISIQIGNKWSLYSFSKKRDFFFYRMFYFAIFIGIMFFSLITPWLKSKIKQIKILVAGGNEKDIYVEIEDNIEEKISGLKSKVNKIGSNLKSDSFEKIIDEIDETFEEIKSIPKKISENYKSHKKFNDRILELIDNKKVSINLNLILDSEEHFEELSIEVENSIIEYLEVCFRIVSAHCNNCNVVLQIVQHNNSINLLMEIDDAIINLKDFEENEEILSILKKVNGEIEIDNIIEIGAIINTSISLNTKKSESISGKDKIKIIIAEDHDVSLFGLTSLFKTKKDIEVVGTARNGMEVLKILETKSVDIVITDISMPGMDGIELSAKLKTEYSQIKVIVFTMYLENWFTEQLVDNGVRGFVSKNSKIIELIEAVRNVYGGSNYYCPQFKSKFGFNGNNKDKSKKLDSLTKTEMQIVMQFGENNTKEQIATSMHLSKKIIDVFVANILLKLNAGDEDEIIRIAKKQ
ncbi:MAG: response regulator [Bacteroidales bacterium]|nr:response regulator [Bacteroidales bacterium]